MFTVEMAATERCMKQIYEFWESINGPSVLKSYEFLSLVVGQNSEMSDSTLLVT
jgi:hypothetical protein